MAQLRVESEHYWPISPLVCVNVTRDSEQGAFTEVAVVRISIISEGEYQRREPCSLSSRGVVVRGGMKEIA